MDPSVQTDTLYQAYSKGLYRFTGDEATDNILDMLDGDTNSNNSTAVVLPSDSIGSGVITGTQIQTTGATQVGKQTFSDTTAGYFLGIDQTDGIAKFSIGNSTNYLTWNGSTLTIVGGATISKIDIPDTTTANSFHVDTSGNSWWGANVATGYTGANAYVLSNGAAVFKNVTIGGTTVQYVITNSGIFSYGDGSDGDATISANTTLASDKYYRNLVINSGAIVNTGQFRIFCSISITISGSSSIVSPGNNGSDASGITAGAGGAAVGAGYFQASAAGGTGSSPGGSTIHSLGGNGGSQGGGGAQFAPSVGGGSGQAPGTATVSNVKLIANWHLATLLDIETGGGGGTGGTKLFEGGGGGGLGGFGGGGLGAPGGGGSAAGMIAVYAKSITIGAGSSIVAAGGNGGNATGASNGGGGGGGGGAGGIIIMVYNTLSNSGSITTPGGTGGTGGAGGGNGAAGSAGISGSTGAIYQFQLSL